jgi:hypothetical protein
MNSARFLSLPVQLLLAFIFCAEIHAGGLYGSDSDVIQLTTANFDQVMSSNHLWIIEFYAPWYVSPP